MKQRKPKIYRASSYCQLQFYSDHCMLPFDMESDQYEFSDDISCCDVIPVATNVLANDEQAEFIRSQYSNQLILMMNLGSTGEDSDTDSYIRQQLEPWLSFTNKMVWVHHNRLQNSYHRQFHYDMMWNRQKLYFTDYQRIDLSNRLWTYHTTRSMYQLEPLEKNKSPRKWLAPMRIYYDELDSPRMQRRLRLQYLLRGQPVWTSDPQAGLVLPSEEYSGRIIKSMMTGGGGTWYPVANFFYEDSFVSIYVESVVTDCGTATLSEKTLDPLIKGHFVLPFGYPGLVADILDYGFKLPDWIDYDYDKIRNDAARWSAYECSLKKLFEIGSDQLRIYWSRDLDLLYHNRELFWVRPYDTLHDKIRHFLNYFSNTDGEW